MSFSQVWWSFAIAPTANLSCREHLMAKETSFRKDAVLNMLNAS